MQVRDFDAVLAGQVLQQAAGGSKVLPGEYFRADDTPIGWLSAAGGSRQPERLGPPPVARPRLAGQDKAPKATGKRPAADPRQLS